MSRYPQETLLGRTRMWAGEQAVICSLAPDASDTDPKSAGSSIRLECRLYYFASWNQLVQTVLGTEANFVGKPEVQLAQPTHLYWRGKLEFAEFEFVDNSRQVASRRVFARSGPYLLIFTLNSKADADRHLFDEFL